MRGCAARPPRRALAGDAGSRATGFVALVAAAALAGSAPPASAGLPCLVDSDGVPLRWSTMPIAYNLDPGPLAVGPGRVISPEAAAALVEAAAAGWAAVPTARLSFATGSSLMVDVDEHNFDDVVGRCGDGLSPIVFDRTGAIIDAALGRGAAAVVLGFTVHDCGAAAAPDLSESSVVINGTAFATLTDDQTRQAFTGVLMHELGHVANLCHSRLNARFADDGDPANDGLLPVMFPFYSDDDPGAAAVPRFDDRTAISMLYPAPDFYASYGTIAGHVLSGRAGRPVSGAEVVVRSASDPLGTAVWTTSGWQRVESDGGVVEPVGAPIPSIDGSYQASGLPPGAYTVMIDGGTIAAGPEFFSGSVESDDPVTDPSGLAEPVDVGAGTLRTNVSVTLDRRVISTLGETEWRVRWRGSVRVSGVRIRLPAAQLPVARLDFLSTGRYRVDPETAFSGVWSARGARRAHFDIDAAALAGFLDAAGGDLEITDANGSGRANRRLSRLRGRISARGVLLFPRTRFLLRLQYRGTRVGEVRVPGRLPLLPVPGDL
jgi:hypothetical protein